MFGSDRPGSQGRWVIALITLLYILGIILVIIVLAT